MENPSFPNGTVTTGETTRKEGVMVPIISAVSNILSFQVRSRLLIGMGLCLAFGAAWTEVPRFTFRGWETQIEGLWCEPRGGTPHWYKNEFYLNYLDDVLKKAPAYNANALILMGRHNYGEVHTFVSYRDWPRLNRIYRERGQADRNLQIRRLNELIEKANKQGVGVFLWTHELQLPSELATLYPSTAGVGTRFCPSSPELLRFVSSKYAEFFDQVPDLAGFFLVLSETQINLLQGSRCQCERCKTTAPEEHLENLIRAVAEPMACRGKRLVIRTFGHSVDECRRICSAINRLPPDLQFGVMSKSTAQDFVGLRYPDHPAFNLIQGHPQLLEDVFGEFRGKTHVVVTPALFYRDRIRRASANGVEGIVMRLDHNGYPKSTFETPNEFNVYFTSRLWTDPDSDPNEIWREWFQSRYGTAPTELVQAFQNSEALWEQGSNTLGVYTVSAHGNLAPLFWGGYGAWDNLNASVSNITRGIPEWDRLGEELLHPTDTTMALIRNEIQEVNSLADDTVDLVEHGSQHLSKVDREELQDSFELLRETVRMFGHLKILFFLGLQAEQSSGDLRQRNMEEALNESQRATATAREIEQQFGFDHWPLQPDDGRGASFYDILEGYWSDTMASILSGRSPRKGGWGKPIRTDLQAARLWRRILDSARPNRTEPVEPMEFLLDKSFQELTFATATVRLKSATGPDLIWPVGMRIEGPPLIAGIAYHLSFENQPECIRVSATPKVNLEASLRAYQQRQLTRDQEIRNRLSSLKELQHYQTKVREKFKQILGPWPERTPLQPQKVGTLEREGYRIEKILIQSQPGFYVPINLYIPTDQEEPMPTVLSPLGHALAGKAHRTHDNYQTRFITLARKGYVVCAYDPLGQGEREPYGAETGNHHSIQGYQCMPSGRHLAQYFIWDGIRCLDYLESRPEVDQKRIACAGCSGGGALTNYISALDPRIAVAVPASWVNDSIGLTEDNGLHVESWFPDVCAPYGLGTRQLLACIAPRPLLILGNQEDKEFPPDRMEAVYRDIRKLYSQVGAEDRVAYASVPTPHGFWPEARRELYRFLNKWFQNEGAGIDEPPTEPESETDLSCAPGGQVRNLPDAQTVYSLNREVLKELKNQRQKRRQTLSASDYQALIREGAIATTFYRDTDGNVPMVEIGRSVSEATTERHILLEYEPGFHALGHWLEGNKKDTPIEVVLIADDNTRGEELSKDLFRGGFNVLRLETPITEDRRAIMSGKPRCGRWSKLLIRGADFLRSRDNLEDSITVSVGIGPNAALATQIAGILEPERFSAIAALEGLDSIESFSEKVTDQNSLQMLPGMFRWFDEADIAAGLAPKPLLISGVTDKKGQFLPRDLLDLRYTWTRSRYSGLENSMMFTLSSGRPLSKDLVDWLRKSVATKVP